MSRKCSGQTLFLSLLSVPLAVLLASGCGSTVNSSPSSGSSGSSGSSSNTGPAFIIATDAPRAGVTSFSVQVQGINAIDANGNSVPLLSGSPTVDFARYNGLQTLLDMNDVPAGTYNSIVITLGSASIGYLDTSGSGAPVIKTEAATFTTS